MHSQIQPIYTYTFDKYGTGNYYNQNMDFTRSLHTVLGYEKFFDKGFNLNVTGFTNVHRPAETWTGLIKDEAHLVKLARIGEGVYRLRSRQVESYNLLCAFLPQSGFAGERHIGFEGQVPTETEDMTNLNLAMKSDLDLFNRINR